MSSIPSLHSAELGAISKRRILLLRVAATVACLASISGLLFGFLADPNQTLSQALDLHGLGSTFSSDYLVPLGWIHLLLAATSYALVIFDHRSALPLLMMSAILSSVTHLFGGLSVSIGFVSFTQLVIYLCEGFMLALLLLVRRE